jgi:hypothetical protein
MKSSSLLDIIFGVFGKSCAKYAEGAGKRRLGDDNFDPLGTLA